MQAEVELVSVSGTQPTQITPTQRKRTMSLLVMPRPRLRAAILVDQAMMVLQHVSGRVEMERAVAAFVFVMAVLLSLLCFCAYDQHMIRVGR